MTNVHAIVCLDAFGCSALIFLLILLICSLDVAYFYVQHVSTSVSFVVLFLFLAVLCISHGPI